MLESKADGYSTEELCERFGMDADYIEREVEIEAQIRKIYPRGRAAWRMRVSPEHAAEVDAQMSSLCETFPSLRGMPGVRPWKPAMLNRWALGRDPVFGLDPSQSAVHAARFVFSVWEENRTWEVGVFDIAKACFSWDDAHKEAWRTWAHKPWWLGYR